MAGFFISNVIICKHEILRTRESTGDGTGAFLRKEDAGMRSSPVSVSGRRWTKALVDGQSGNPDPIMEAVAAALRTEFGDACKIYTDDLEQGLERPCFFVSCAGSSDRLFLGRRYFRENKFRIRYLPGEEGKENGECRAVAERLFEGLKWITVAGAPQMGTKMQCEMPDGMLQFFVNYDFFAYRAADEIPVMEEMSKKTIVKG